MKTLILTITAILLIPQAALAQKSKGVIKAAEAIVIKTGETAATKATAAAGIFSKQLENSIASKQKEMAETAQQRQEKEDALLRGRLLGEKAFPNSMVLRKNQKAAQHQAQAVSNKEKALRLIPAQRLAKEKRRLNIPLAKQLLLTHKEDIIKHYSLTDDYLEGYYLRRIYPYMDKPSFLPEKNGHLYRGVFMTVDELNATLQNGFLTSMNTWNVGAKNRGDKFISFSSSTGEAMSYIFQGTGNAAHPKGIGVVFEVEKDIDGLEFWQDAKLNSTNTIYHCYKNVPPSKIRNVYVFGQYGLENLAEIFIKARRNALPSRDRWIHDFDSRFLR